MSLIRILLAEDHDLVREGTRRLLEQYSDLAVVGEAADGEEAVRLTGELGPDVVVMDVRMPKLNGIQATRALKAAHPQVRVLVLSAHEDDSYVFPLLEAGADGYLLKTASGEDLAQAIRSVMRGQSVFDSQVMSKVVSRLDSRHRTYSGEGLAEALTEREMEVLRALSTGKSNKEIAADLAISTYTVQVHVRNILGKLGVSSRTEAVAFALRQGWLSVDDLE
ncbi:MAG: response regulator [Anaerolineae bacterium]|jgi:DNA-binding NarL/FixJ family response regulator